MTTKYYIDTSIWMDLHENRMDKFRPLGEWAFELMKLIRDNKELIVYSDLVIQELSQHYKKEEVENIMKIATDNNLLIKAEINDCQIIEASKLSKYYNIPFGDALHAVLSRDNNAILVTRDHHFLKLINIVIFKKPEELI